MDASGLVLKIAQVIINPTITLLFAVAVFYFVWGLVKYIQNADDPGKRKEGAQHMLWGLIGLFIMVSAYAIMKAFLDAVF